mgnify:CR=1 FL=1
MDWWNDFFRAPPCFGFVFTKRNRCANLIGKIYKLFIYDVPLMLSIVSALSQLLRRVPTRLLFLGVLYRFQETFQLAGPTHTSRIIRTTDHPLSHIYTNQMPMVQLYLSSSIFLCKHLLRDIFKFFNFFSILMDFYSFYYFFIFIFSKHRHDTAKT